MKLSRIITAVLCLSLIMGLSISAFADDEDIMPCSNTEDTTFFKTAPIEYTFVHISGREKQDSSPAYVYISSLTNEDIVRVRIVGTNAEGHACTSNEYTCNTCSRCTARGTWVPYVRCKKGIKYSVSSLVYERGYTYSTLGFQSTSTTQTQKVEGKWSPDAIGRYNTPDAP